MPPWPLRARFASFARSAADSSSVSTWSGKEPSSFSVSSSLEASPFGPSPRPFSLPRGGDLGGDRGAGSRAGPGASTMALRDPQDRESSVVEPPVGMVTAGRGRSPPFRVFGRSRGASR